MIGQAYDKAQREKEAAEQAGTRHLDYHPLIIVAILTDPHSI